jgi:hypothetical protein
MLPSLRGMLRPREGAGQPPALLLDLGLLAPSYRKASCEQGAGYMVETQPAGAQRVSSEDSTAAPSLIRWGGPAAALGGVLVMIGSFFSAWINEALYSIGFALLVVGITGIYLYLRRSGRIGPSGRVGFYMSVFAFVVVSILSLGVLLNVLGGRWVDTISALNLLVILGTAMFGIAILRAKRLPKGGAWLLIAFAPAEVGIIVAMAVSGYTLPDFVWSVSAILFGLGWVWLGYGLWSESGASAGGRASRVS